MAHYEIRKMTGTEPWVISHLVDGVYRAIARKKKRKAALLTAGLLAGRRGTIVIVDRPNG